MRLSLSFALLLLALIAIGVQAPAPATAAPATSLDIVFVARAHLATQQDAFPWERGPAGQFGFGLTKFAPAASS